MWEWFLIFIAIKSHEGLGLITSYLLKGVKEPAIFL